MTNIVELKINGQPIQVDTDKLHETWVAKCLEYGVRRFINDSHSGAKGQDKYEACLNMAVDMQKGEPVPVRVTVTKAHADPVEALAFKNAKAALTAMFKAVTGANKAFDFIAHPKVKPFFNVTEDRAVWNDATVQAWMEKQAKEGKTDYMADAKATLEMAQSDDLDF
tara:strand:- start:415 stop:915 length:501 start_codon:yes stop_codon:yes gene_type:complete